MSNFGGRSGGGDGFPFSVRDFGVLPLGPTFNILCAGTIAALLNDADENEIDFGDLEEATFCDC